MKFYYNGKLIRTSKTHIYKFALLNYAGNCVTCSATYEGCLKEKNRRKSDNERRIENYGTMLKALKEGRQGYFVKDGRRGYYSRFTGKENAEQLAEWLEALIKGRSYYEEEKIVELEAR
jgi:hypothetical protein